MNKWIGYSLIGFGAASVVAGGVLLSKKRSSNLGRTINTLAPPAPMMFQEKQGDTTVKHFRSKDMPIEQRVRHIQDMVWQSIKDGDMRRLSAQITQHCASRDGECEARAIFDAVKKQVRYTGDMAAIKLGADGPHEPIDVFQHARVTWGAVKDVDKDARKPKYLGFGDCDDHSILNDTLLAYAGIPVKVRVTAPSKDSNYAHIYALAGLPKLNPRKWYAMDTTLPNGKFGQEVPFGKHLDFKDDRLQDVYVKDFPA